MKDKEEKKCHCHDEPCNEHCECDNDCNCGEESSCNDNHDCHCHDDNHDCQCEEKTNYQDLYMRAMADFDNYRRRAINSIADARTDGKIDALNTILPALDTFRQATSMITDKNTLIGVQYIEKNILSALDSLGVTKIDASGEFDPDLHCAVSTDSESDVPAGTIVKVLADGYKLGDKVIRYSQVIVKK